MSRSGEVGEVVCKTIVASVIGGTMIRREVSGIDWGSAFEGKTTNGQWAIPQNEMARACDKYIPKFKSTGKCRAWSMWDEH